MIMNRKIFYIFIIGILLLPNVIFADDFTPNTINVDIIESIIIYAWRAFVFITVVFFILAGISFLTAKGDPTKIETAKRFVSWGTVGIVATLIGFSMVAILNNTLNPSSSSGASTPSCASSTAPACNGGGCPAGQHCGIPGTGGCGCVPDSNP